MSREEQIKDMARAIHLNCHKGLTSTEAEMIAKWCYQEIDRVSLKNAREIFEEIEKTIADLEYSANTPRKTVKVEELKSQCDWILHEVIPKTLAELKKKYTQEK